MSGENAKHFPISWLCKLAVENDIGRRINVVGVSGCGKTTMASRIAQRLGLRHIELDALHWRENWAEAPLDEFRRQVREALRGDGWVADGNYSKVRDVVWGRADTIVWLDYPLLLIMRRLLWRTLRRIFARRSCGPGTGRAPAWSFSAGIRSCSGPCRRTDGGGENTPSFSPVPRTPTWPSCA